MQEVFRKFSIHVSRMIGSFRTFLVFILLLSVTGIWYQFSFEWESKVGFIVAVINLSVLFFLQKSQNHSDKATHLKLDELIKAVGGARNEIAATENRSEAELEELRNNEKLKYE